MAESLTPIQLDRAAGVLVGAAAGDALGAGYEFRSVCTSGKVRMKPGSLTGRPAGSWTDDTDMAIGVAQALATGRRLDRTDDGVAAVARRFAEWYASQPPDIGNQTRAVLSAAHGRNGGRSSGEAMLACAADYQAKHPEAAGNGSLMRTGPVALGALGDDARILHAAQTVSALTHPHRRAAEACALWSIAIDRAIREGHLDGLRQGIALLPEDSRAFWADAVRRSEQAPPSELRENGYVVTALQAAWHAIATTDDQTGPAHLKAGLRAAVGLGGDTDTVAAIAGALLGARYGASAVPFAWRYRLAGWPPGTTHADLVALGVLAARGGEPDPIGWPLARDLSDYYERHWPTSGATHVVDGQGDLLWGDVAGLATVEADAVVSLSRIGRRQRRGADHHQVWLMDGPDNADLPFVLADTADGVELLRRRVGTVFVHCVACQSRTPSVAAAWLIRHRGLSADDALAEVLRAIPRARPNRAMVDALQSVGEVDIRANANELAHSGKR